LASAERYQGLELYTPPWSFEASLELPLLFEVSNANLPEASDAHSVGFAPVVHSGADVKVAKWLIPSLSADLVINAVPPWMALARSSTQRSSCFDPR
jgi:hypothetical protein